MEEKISWMEIIGRMVGGQQVEAGSWVSEKPVNSIYIYPVHS